MRPASSRDHLPIHDLCKKRPGRKDRLRRSCGPFGPFSRILGHARVTITLDIYTHLFEGARHALHPNRMAASPFAGLLEPTTPAPGATVLKLR